MADPHAPDPTPKPSPLAIWRARYHLSQEDAAHVAGCVVSTWRHWEHGRVVGPDLETLRRLEADRPGLAALLLPEVVAAEPSTPTEPQD